VLIVGFFLLGLEQVAEDIQDPFGKEPDDLPLDRLCQTLADTVSAILPEEPEHAEVR
jgi:putative membrane protein